MAAAHEIESIFFHQPLRPSRLLFPLFLRCLLFLNGFLPLICLVFVILFLHCGLGRGRLVGVGVCIVGAVVIFIPTENINVKNAIEEILP